MPLLSFYGLHDCLRLAFSSSLSNRPCLGPTHQADEPSRPVGWKRRQPGAGVEARETGRRSSLATPILLLSPHVFSFFSGKVKDCPKVHSIEELLLREWGVITWGRCSSSSTLAIPSHPPGLYVPLYFLRSRLTNLSLSLISVAAHRASVANTIRIKKQQKQQKPTNTDKVRYSIARLVCYSSRSFCLVFNLGTY